MGLFSSKRKYIVNVTTQPLFEEAGIPDSARQGIIKGIISDGSIVDNMLEDLANSLGIRAGNALAWAKKNEYAFGIPQSSTRSNVDGRSVVLATIANNVGQAITPIYYTMAPMNSFHYAWSWLVNTHGYDPETNEIVSVSADVGHKCYLSGMVATYTQESYDFMVETHDLGMVEQMGPPPNSGYTPSKPFTALNTIGEYNKQPNYEVSSVAVEDYVTITFEYEIEPGVYGTGGLTLPLTAIDLDQDFHQCRYKKADGKTGFFSYQQGSGTYPTIDAIYTLGFEGNGTFFPYIYFKVNDIRPSDLWQTKEYRDLKKYADYLGVNYSILDEEVYKDPDIGDVAQSMLMFGINPGNKDKYCIQYLFHHFDLLHAASLPPSSKANDLEEKFNVFTSSPSQYQRIRDRYFAMTLQYSGIQKRRKPGKIGKLGEYTSEYATVAQGDQHFFFNGAEGVEQSSAPSSQPAWIYRRQVTDSVYEEIAIFNLRANYEVHEKKGFGAGAQDKELLIPVDREVLRALSTRGKEQVLSRGLQFFVSTVQMISTPWYASSTFKIIMIIVAIVITIISVGQAWQSIVAAASLGAGALILTIATYIVTALAINYGVKLFVKEFGAEVGLIAAIAAIAIGSYYGTGSTGGDANWADSLVGVGTNLASTSNQVIQEGVQDALTQIEQFNAYAMGMFDDLADAKEQLGLVQQYVGLEPLEMVYRVPDIRLGESPNDLYSRTVHSGNIGVVCYDIVEYFVQTKLTLPTLADIEGEVPDNGLAV